MKRSVIVPALVALLASSAVVSAGEDEKLLAGFEWEEFAPRVGRDMALGKPLATAAQPGFRAERYESVDQVGEEGFQVFRLASSRDWPGLRIARAHATQGRFALDFDPRSIEMGSWANLERVARGEGTHTFAPGAPGYDPVDWYYQRFCHVWQENWTRTTDWSAYDRLRFDVHAAGSPVRLGMRVRDGVGPSIGAGPTGIKTALAVFTVPADRTVTCELPLGELARLAEMDLSKVHRAFIRLNGLPEKKAPTGLYLDNIRLVRAGAKVESKLKVIGPDDPPAAFARPVHVRPPTVRDPALLKRNVAPVQPLGPVTINQACLYIAGAGHMIGPGHFGGSGATYFRNARRGVVAYDNDRLAVVMTGAADPRGAGGSGLIALASFDGGTTWGGLTEQDKERGFTLLPWRLRAGVSADYAGDIYYLGTPNCDSYREGQDICVHRLAFTGRTWVDDRFAIIYQDGYKCPAYGRVLRLDSGRVWAAWLDGFGGYFAKASDDDALTFRPCKDASLPPPRPFHEPKLGDPQAVASAPRQVLLWPGERVAGPFLAPYGGGVAAISADRWQAHDGQAWGPEQPGPKWLGDVRTLGVVSETIVGDCIFLARSARYSDTGQENLAALQAAWQDGDGWKVEQLEDGEVSVSILTASGSTVFCFYVRKAGENYEVRCRRFRDGTWQASELLASEPFRINHVAAPQTCPPSYAAVFYDQYQKERKGESVVRFIRVPNR